jgi:hypothetical protein
LSNPTSSRPKATPTTIEIDIDAEPVERSSVREGATRATTSGPTLRYVVPKKSRDLQSDEKSGAAEKENTAAVLPSEVGRRGQKPRAKKPRLEKDDPKQVTLSQVFGGRKPKTRRRADDADARHALGGHDASGDDADGAGVVSDDSTRVRDIDDDALVLGRR